jgi:hypothetical protein
VCVVVSAVRERNENAVSLQAVSNECTPGSRHRASSRCTAYIQRGVYAVRCTMSEYIKDAVGVNLK